LFEAAAFVVEQLEKEGRSIRAESDHPLFPHRPVQTCHGIIGDNGEHPSRINGEVPFDIVFDAAPADPPKTRKLIDDAIEFALNEYTGVYGDKTGVIDENTGKPKVDHHFDLVESDRGCTVTVFGSTGHMGSIFENDGAITKMMTMVRSLIRSRDALQRAAGSPVRFQLNGWAQRSRLLMEGGQGFLPTHSLDDIQARLRQAVWRGADDYLRLVGSDARAADVFEVTFEKLHNAAFAGATDSPEVTHAIEAARAAGIWNDDPIRGWDVSCDARIFACEYEDLDVLTTGAGSLNCAHSDVEFIDVAEMVKMAEFLAYYILKQTGTVQ
jgi:acetylornithine deacetylase/succinyl-diaminopimelate desuccinylase-like protein